MKCKVIVNNFSLIVNSLLAYYKNQGTSHSQAIKTLFNMDNCSDMIDLLYLSGNHEYINAWIKELYETDRIRLEKIIEDDTVSHYSYKHTERYNENKWLLLHDSLMDNITWYNNLSKDLLSENKKALLGYNFHSPLRIIYHVNEITNSISIHLYETDVNINYGADIYRETKDMDYLSVMNIRKTKDQGDLFLWAEIEKSKINITEYIDSNTVSDCKCISKIENNSGRYYSIKESMKYDMNIYNIDVNDDI